MPGVLAKTDETAEVNTHERLRAKSEGVVDFLCFSPVPTLGVSGRADSPAFYWAIGACQQGQKAWPPLPVCLLKPVSA